MGDQERPPVDRARRWVVVTRRPGAAAVISEPMTLERAQAQRPDWDDQRLGVYELRPVRDEHQ